VRTIQTLSFLLILVSAHCLADFKSGGAAYKRGDYETAYKEFLPLANKGDHRAMYALGSMYAGGQGVERDLKQAIKWFKEAAKYGRADAMFKLGIMYEEGHGTKQNLKRAVNWYGKSAKRGYPMAQFKLGALYYMGKGLKQNNIHAYAWLGLAATRNLSEAVKLIDKVKSSMTENELEQANVLLGKYQKKYGKR